MQESALRNDTRRRTVVLVRIADRVRAEPDLAAVEVEARSVDEADIGIRIVELVARTVDPEIVVVHEPFRVGQDHDADGKRAETELARGAHDDFASPTDGTTTMTDAELRGDDEDVRVALSLSQLTEELLCVL